MPRAESIEVEPGRWHACGFQGLLEHGVLTFTARNSGPRSIVPNQNKQNPYMLNPEPLNPKTETPQALSPKPQTLNPKPQTHK